MTDYFTIKIKVIPATDDDESTIEVMKITKLDPPKMKLPPKARDMSPISIEMYHTIHEQYKLFRDRNMQLPTNCKESTQDFADSINRYYGRDKTVTTWAGIWNGTLDINTLKSDAEIAMDKITN